MFYNLEAFLSFLDIRQLREHQHLLSQQLEEKQITEKTLSSAIDEQEAEVENMSETRHRVSETRVAV